MSVQLLVLAGIALFLILRLRSVLGTREGFENPASTSVPEPAKERDFRVIEGGPDHDIIDHVEEGSPSALALADMKKADNTFHVGEFLSGAKSAYEMIFMAFERGDIEEIRWLLSPEIEEIFDDAIAQRAERGLSIEAEFLGFREIKLVEAIFENSTQEAEVSMSFVSELTSVVKNDAGEVVEGDAKHAKKNKDVWTFARNFGSDDVNWRLVATGE